MIKELTEAQQQTLRKHFNDKLDALMREFVENDEDFFSKDSEIFCDIIARAKVPIDNGKELVNVFIEHHFNGLERFRTFIQKFCNILLDEAKYAQNNL